MGWVDTVLKDADADSCNRGFYFYSRGVSPNLIVVPYSDLGDYLRNAPGHIEQIREANSKKKGRLDWLLKRRSPEERFGRSLVFLEIDHLVFQGFEDIGEKYPLLKLKGTFDGGDLSAEILYHEYGAFFIFPGGTTVALDSPETTHDLKSLKRRDEVRITGSPSDPETLDVNFAVYCLERHPLPTVMSTSASTGRRIEKANQLLTAQDKVVLRNYSVFGNYLGD